MANFSRGLGESLFILFLDADESELVEAATIVGVQDHVFVGDTTSLVGVQDAAIVGEASEAEEIEAAEAVGKYY